MELKFESIGELREFLDFAGFVPGRDLLLDTVTMTLPDPIVGGTADLDWVKNALPPDDVQQGGVTNGSEPEQVTPDEGQAPKRKRRTKAEIAADEAAAKIGAAATQPETSNDNPFAQVGSENVQAILNAPDQKSAIAAGIAATSSGTVEDDEPASEEPAPAATAPIGDVTPVDHMNRCREFIAAQGMTKYNESFTLAGLSANIMGYSPEQRALHAATLAQLSAA